MEAQENSYPLEKWKEKGFFEGVPEDREQKACDAFNLTLNYLIKIENDTESFSTIPFPIIHRIIRTHDLTEEEIIKIIHESITQYNVFNETSELQFMTGLDLEAHFTLNYAEQKIEELNTKATQIGLDQLREQKEATISKWKSMGLLEGLVGYDDSKNIAQFGIFK